MLKTLSTQQKIRAPFVKIFLHNGNINVNQGKIVTRDDIMNYLWGTDKFIDDNTLTVNMTRLRKKIAKIGLVDVIETRRDQGYILI